MPEAHDWSERRACQAVGLPRSTARYRRRPDRDEAVIALLAELAERFPERGFDKLFQPIRRRGLVWNHKRVDMGSRQRELAGRRSAARRTDPDGSLRCIRSLLSKTTDLGRRHHGRVVDRRNVQRLGDWVALKRS